MKHFYICAIIKNEHRYLVEWIEHHLSLGFDAIYLFEDFGSKSHSEIADKYPQVHLITCDEYFPIKRDYDVGWARQIRLYQKFLNEHRNEGWCAFIDIDEYIMLNDGYTLQKLTEEHADTYGIALYWKQFNANGRIMHADKVVETYTHACECIRQDRKYAFKSFVNLNKAREFWSQHLVENLIDVTGRRLSHSEPTKANYAKVQLNHYFCKSYEDWCDRFVRGDLAPSHRKFEQFFENNPKMRPVAYMKHIINRRRYKDFVANDLISVCMCTYNRAHYLDNVIANILSQTYMNIEFVIVDDGSTDNSREILDKWSSQDSRVRVIYSNHDFIKSRNLAFKEARGEYIACMDSDDECSLDRIEKQYKYLQEYHDVDIVGCKASGFNRPCKSYETHEQIMQTWSSEENEISLFGTLLIRKAILSMFKHDFFFDIFNECGEDTIFKLCALSYGARFANLQEYLYQYHHGPHSISYRTVWRPDNFRFFIKNVKTITEAINRVRLLQKSTSKEERLRFIKECKDELIRRICLQTYDTCPICAAPVTDDLCMYIIGKCGCTTISEASTSYYKSHTISALPTHPYRGKHNIMESAEQIDRPIVLVYRDPIDRWKSFFNNKVKTNGLGSPIVDMLKAELVDFTVDDAITATKYSLIEHDSFSVDSHIRPISSHIDKLQKVDIVIDLKDLPAFFKEHNIPYSKLNSGGQYNIDLTSEQESLLKELYAEDYKLLDKYELWKPSSK